MALTVGELRSAIKDLPDSLEVRLLSDTNVDCEGRAIIENISRVDYESDKGRVDYCAIYANQHE